MRIMPRTATSDAGDEQGADDDLDEKQDVAHGEAAEGAGENVTALDRLEDIGAPDLPRRKDGRRGCRWRWRGRWRRDRRAASGAMRKWVGKSSGAPVGERAEQQAGEEGADDAADEGDEHGFREQLARNHPAAGADGETDGELAAAVGGARGEDAGEVGAGGEQDEHGQQRHAEQRFLHGVVAVAGGPGLAHGEGEAFVLRILLRHLPRDGVHASALPAAA